VAVTSYALSFSGGKDSMLALDRAVRQGLHVSCLFNIYEGNSQRVRFHGIRAPLVAAQADALGISLMQEHTHPEDYETVLLRVLDRLRDQGISGIIFGNIHLADIRGWYEERTISRGFRHVEPLWGDAPLDLAAEVVERGYTPIVVSVDLARTPVEWLGRPFDRALLSDIAARPEIDPAGERGEYHTFVTGGPLFRRPLDVVLGRQVEMEGHALIDVRLRGER
jgi:diphthine-ammonia ligase